jgi:hypothetical protein
VSEIEKFWTPDTSKALDLIENEVIRIAASCKNHDKTDVLNYVIDTLETRNFNFVSSTHTETVDDAFPRVFYIFGHLQAQKLLREDIDDLDDIEKICLQVTNDWKNNVDIQSHEEEGYPTVYAERILLEKYGRDSKRYKNKEQLDYLESLCGRLLIFNVEGDDVHPVIEIHIKREYKPSLAKNFLEPNLRNAGFNEKMVTITPFDKGERGYNELVLYLDLRLFDNVQIFNLVTTINDTITPYASRDNVPF